MGSVGTFTVLATVANPNRPERRVTLGLTVDTGATYTFLPAEVVAQLGLLTPRRRRVTLASGEQVTYPMGQVAMRLNGEELVTVFLAGPSGSDPLLVSGYMQSALSPVRLAPPARGARHPCHSSAGHGAGPG